MWSYQPALVVTEPVCEGSWTVSVDVVVHVVVSMEGGCVVAGSVGVWHVPVSVGDVGVGEGQRRADCHHGKQSKHQLEKKDANKYETIYLVGIAW